MTDTIVERFATNQQKSSRLDVMQWVVKSDAKTHRPRRLRSRVTLAGAIRVKRLDDANLPCI